jgi:N-acetylmuramoyl-L-alanine amidase
VTEMLRPYDVAWDAHNWYINMHAINIETEGFAAQGGTWYAKAMYSSCAALVRYLAARYGIPLDRQHILGHEDVPGVERLLHRDAALGSRSVLELEPLHDTRARGQRHRGAGERRLGHARHPSPGDGRPHLRYQ